MLRIVMILGFLPYFAAPISAAEPTKANLYVGGGASIPTDDASSNYNVGFHGAAAVGLPLSPTFQFEPAIAYHSFSISNTSMVGMSGARTIFSIGGNGKLTLTSPGQKCAFYALGGVGESFVRITRRYSFDGWHTTDNFSHVYLNVGAGVDFQSRSTSAVFLEFRIVTMSVEESAVTYIPITLGVKL